MNGNVLIVDDHPGICLLLSEVLTHKDYRVTTVNDGQKALNILSETVFDIVLLDYKLPLIDGLAVIEELDRRKSRIPIIVMSGLSEQLTSLFDYPFVKAMISKPFDLNEVEALIEAHGLKR